MKLSIAAVILIAALQQARADPEIHLIPDGYVGEVTIVFRAGNAEVPTTEAGARVYRIPPNGVLLTQAEPNRGTSPAWRFFTVAATGERKPIHRIWASTVHDTSENRASNEFEVFYPSRGSQQAGRLPCRVEFDQYFVGTRAHLLSRDASADRRRLSLVLESQFICM